MDLLYDVALLSIKRGILPLSTRRDIILLLPKKNKDTQFMKNMRPLTLLNSDYKIIAKIFDNHLRLVLPYLVHQDQTGFIAGQTISMNTRNLLDIIEYTRNQNIPAVIMSIDFEKCFDKIDYSAIFGALKYFNFEEYFVKSVKLFYTQFEVCMQNYGFQSQFFVKSRSVNQGCIISPRIFLLTSEILANKLRNDPEVCGIKI